MTGPALYSILTDLASADLSPEDRAEMQPWIDRLGAEVIPVPEDVIARMREIHSEL